MNESYININRKKGWGEGEEHSKLDYIHVFEGTQTNNLSEVKRCGWIQLSGEGMCSCSLPGLTHLPYLFSTSPLNGLWYQNSGIFNSLINISVDLFTKATSLLAFQRNLDVLLMYPSNRCRYVSKL